VVCVQEVLAGVREKVYILLALVRKRWSGEEGL
jgi:hypothetical protein